MGFLKEKKLFETLNSLQLECGQADEDLGCDLQKIGLTGQVLQFVPVRSNDLQLYTLYYVLSRDLWHDMLLGGMTFCSS